jgi:hypothetical protein
MFMVTNVACFSVTFIPEAYVRGGSSLSETSVEEVLEMEENPAAVVG